MNDGWWDGTALGPGTGSRPRARRAAPGAVAAAEEPAPGSRAARERGASTGAAARPCQRLTSQQSRPGFPGGACFMDERGGAGPSSPAGQGRSWAVAKSGRSGAAGEKDRGRGCGAPSTSSPGSRGLGARQTVDSSVYCLPSMCLSLALCHSCLCLPCGVWNWRESSKWRKVGCLGRDDCATWLEWPKDFEVTDICWIKTAVRIRPLISPPPMLKLQWKPQPTREGRWQQHFGSLKAQVWGVSVPGPNSAETWETTRFKPESSKGSGTTRDASGIRGEGEMEVRMSENKGE